MARHVDVKNIRDWLVIQGRNNDAWYYVDSNLGHVGRFVKKSVLKFYNLAYKL